MRFRVAADRSEPKPRLVARLGYLPRGGSCSQIAAEILRGLVFGLLRGARKPVLVFSVNNYFTALYNILLKYYIRLWIRPNSCFNRARFEMLAKSGWQFV